LAFVGYSNLVFAIAADVGVTLIVILTSLNLLKFENRIGSCINETNNRKDTACKASVFALPFAFATSHGQNAANAKESASHRTRSPQTRP
jgi:hypothetical protein